MADSPTEYTRVFISYSHTDERYLKELRVHLTPYALSRQIEVWDDTRIQSGTDWKKEIKQAIASAKVVILLVSADFMASKFSTTHELPLLLEAARSKGIRILPVIVGTTNFTSSELGQLQTVNSPSKPLNRLRPDERNMVWARVVNLIKETLPPPATSVKSVPEPQSAKTRVFVSHSHKDDDFTIRFVADLRAAGVEVWVDMEKIQHGDFIRRINEGLKASEWLVLVLTPDALASPAVENEVNASIMRVWNKQMKGFIPFMALPCESAEIPVLWDTFHRYNATDGYDKALAGLLRALGIE